MIVIRMQEFYMIFYHYRSREINEFCWWSCRLILVKFISRSVTPVTYTCDSSLATNLSILRLRLMRITSRIQKFLTELFSPLRHMDNFYRATLRVSAVFAVARCLSVCLSRWCIVSTRMKVSSNFVIGAVAPFYFPPPPAPIPNYKGNPFSGGATYAGGGKKIAIFDWNGSLSRKRYEIGPWLQKNAYRKS